MATIQLKPYEYRFFKAAAEYARAYRAWQESVKTCQDSNECARRCNRAMAHHLSARNALEKAANRFVTAERITK